MAVNRVRTGQKVEMLWNCSYCGSTKILARNKACPNCGRARIGGAYLGDNPKERILSEEDKKLFTGKADWYCDYCDSMNPSNAETCMYCGSAREESKKGYSDRKREQIAKGEIPIEKNVILPSKKTEQKEECSYKASSSVSKKVVQNDTEDFVYSAFGNSFCHEENLSLKKRQKNSFKNPFSSFNMKQVLLTLVVFIACTLSIWGIVYACMPKSDTITVESISWERNIETEIEKTFSESGWTLPVGARLLYSQQEWHHDDKVIDHYEDVEITKYNYEKVGERTWTEYEENEDGTADIIKCSEDVYDYVPYQTTESQPVYKKVPVFQTKYYYEIDKYVHNRNLKTSGQDKDVYWSNKSLVTKERENRRTERYFVSAYNENNELKKYTLDYSVWKDVEIGETFKVKVHLGGKVDIVDEDGNVISSLENE